MRGINSGSMHSARMATVTAVTFIVAFAPILYGHAEIKVDPNAGDCSAGNKETKEIKVSQPNTTMTVKCKEKDKVKPKFNVNAFDVCTQKDCVDPQRLSSYITGATVKDVTDTTATITIGNLPTAPKTFYIQCGTSESDSCYILVKVDRAPTESGGVTTGGPQSCAAAGEAITIKIPKEGSTAQFTCGDLTLYPLATDKVFAEDCKKEENLKDIVRSDKERVYTLTAKKKPPKKKWCYLCAKSSVKPGHLGTASDYCLVHVESSSRTQSSSVIALAAMLPCVLAMLRIT